MIQLKEVREVADIEKVVKATVREAKASARVEKKKVQWGNLLPKRQGRPKKAVQISDEVTVIDLEAPRMEIGDDSEWAHIGDFEDPTPPPARKKTKKVWERAQRNRSTG